MTCAACASRIQRRLNKIEGVRAEVNLATETARVEHPAAVTADELTATVRALGYTATPEVPSAPPRRAAGDTIAAAAAAAAGQGQALLSCHNHAIATNLATPYTKDPLCAERLMATHRAVMATRWWSSTSHAG